MGLSRAGWEFGVRVELVACIPVLSPDFLPGICQPKTPYSSIFNCFLTLVWIHPRICFNYKKLTWPYGEQSQTNRDHVASDWPWRLGPSMARTQLREGQLGSCCRDCGSRGRQILLASPQGNVPSKRKGGFYFSQSKRIDTCDSGLVGSYLCC